MKLKSWAVVVVGSFLGVSCAKSNFSGAVRSTPKEKKSGVGEGVNGSSDSTNSAQGSGGDGSGSPDGLDAGSANGSFSLQQLGCDDELRTVTAKLAIHKSGTEQVVSLTHMCKLQVDTQAVSSTKYPTDIVFAIDITGSMQPNINAIKSNVVKFARELETRAWDARFAAVGFRDSIDSTVDFTDAESLANRLQNWSAAGGGNEQEFSQGGIAKALDMLLSDSSSNPSRAKADKVVLMVTDNPGFDYVSKSYNDFSTKNLEQKIQQAAFTLTRLKFYHSTPSSSAFSLAPRDQYNSVITNTGVVGSSLNYPLTEDVILSQFVEKFEPVRAKVDRFCRISKLEVRDAGGIVRSVDFSVKPGETLQSAVVKSNILPRNSLAQLTGQRCCSETEDPNAACTETKPISIPFRVN